MDGHGYWSRGLSEPRFRGRPILLIIALTFGVCLHPAHADPVISEFLADNGGSLLDGDGQASDWIELHNPTQTTIALAGWMLRDGVDLWRFPDVSLPAGSYLVVFASGQTAPDYVDAGGSLHTTFKLDASGESLALLRPDQSVAFEYVSVPRQYEDIAYGLYTESVSYLTPTSNARIFFPNAPVPNTWREAGFDDAGWIAGQASAGFNREPGPVLDDGNTDSHTAYVVEAGTPGNQAYDGALGMDFEVIEEIRVTGLGVFDADSDGLFLTLTAQLWSRSGDAGIAILASETFTPADPGALEGGSRIKPFTTPLILAPGSYTVVAYGYGPAEQNGNQGGNLIEGLDIDPAGGALQFTGGSRYGSAGGFPTTEDGGPANRYAAGTFTYAVSGDVDFEFDVEAFMSGTHASMLMRVPFDVADTGGVDQLRLNIGFDDGFAAWINGVEIAGRNAPGPLTYDASAATASNNVIAVPFSLPGGTLLPTGNVLAIHGLNIQANDSDFIVRPAVTQVRMDAQAHRYFLSATPGAPNDPSGVSGFVDDTQFSIDRGFFTAPFSVTITTATAGATIRFTTDGSEPTATHGTLYAGPLAITNTTVLRAVAFKDGLGPTDVDTQSYLFLDHAAVRDTVPPGYPATWGAVAADYTMDKDPVDYARAAGNLGYTAEEARAAVVTSLTSLPTLSIVTDKDHLFDPGTGIYANPSGRGASWERPVSVEWIATNGTGRFQVDAGLRIMGFTSRDLTYTPKLNMRLLFKKEYGAAKLAFPFLGPEGPDAFNTIALRGNTRDSFIFGSQSYLKDEWAKRAQYDLGQPAVRGTFVHVYLNGIYWGVYNPTERPDDYFAETYLGGDHSEYDVVKFCCPDRSIAGSIDVWNTLLAESRAGVGSNADYLRVQGLDPDGTPNPGYPALIDVDNFIDYVINGQFHASLDWPGNYYAIRDRIDGRSEGFKFFTWDNDLAFDPNADKVQPSPGHNWWTESPGEMDIALRANREYRLRFADRVYKHLFNDGAMSLSNNLARWNTLADAVRPALFAESARWGDARQSIRTVQDHWDPLHQSIVTSYFPNRPATVLGQLRTHDLYPPLDAPGFSQFGGAISNGFKLIITHANGSGQIYFTADGSDPREFGTGAVSAGAQAYSVPLLFNGPTRVRARVLDGGTWSAQADAIFYPPQDLDELALTEIMYHPPDDGGMDGDEFEFLELWNAGSRTLDLSELTFTAGITFTFPLGTTLSPGDYVVLVRNPTAFALKYPTVNVDGIYAGKLDNGGETLTLSHDIGHVIFSVTYDGSLPWPVAPDQADFSLVPVDPGGSQAPDRGARWRASTFAGGSPGAADPPPVVPGVVIDELLTHTDPPQVDAIELYNPADGDADISGWFLTDDADFPAKFRIPEGTVLPSGGRWVFDETDFNPLPGSHTSFALDSTGDEVYLFSATMNGSLTGYSQGVAFGAAFNGVSFGRHVNSVGESFHPAQLLSSLGTESAGPRVGPLVISEIHYHPGPGGYEFVEVANITSQPVPLYDPAHPTNAWKLNGIAYTFPTNQSLEANGVLVLSATNPVAFRAHYGVSGDVEILGPYAGRLRDGGETLELQAPDTPDLEGGVPYVVMDAVRYHDTAPWPPAADGSGMSLQRRVNASYGNEPLNWIAATPTPGQQISTGDADADGLPDLWEQQHKTLLFIADADADTDADGMTHLEEYIAGTDPNDGNSRFMIVGWTAAPSSPAVIVDWMSVSGRLYEVQGATDPNGPFMTLQSGMMFPQASYTNGSGSANAYYRMEVSRPGD